MCWHGRLYRGVSTIFAESYPHTGEIRVSMDYPFHQCSGSFSYWLYLRICGKKRNRKQLSDFIFKDGSMRGIYYFFHICVGKLCVNGKRERRSFGNLYGCKCVDMSRGSDAGTENNLKYFYKGEDRDEQRISY